MPAVRLRRDHPRPDRRDPAPRSASARGSRPTTRPCGPSPGGPSGSMRDAQSLLEQLLSFGGERLTAELVHQQLGIASDERTLDLLDALADRDAAAVLALVDQAVAAGRPAGRAAGRAARFPPRRDGPGSAGAEREPAGRHAPAEAAAQGGRRPLAARHDPGRAADPGRGPGAAPRQPARAAARRAGPGPRGPARVDDRAGRGHRPARRDGGGRRAPGRAPRKKKPASR